MHAWARLFALAATLPLSLAGCERSSPGGEDHDTPPSKTTTETGPSRSDAVDEPEPESEPEHPLAPRAPTVLAFAEAPAKGAPNGRSAVTLLAEGEEAVVTMLELDPHAAIPEHRDGTEVFLHILSGGGTMTIDGEDYELDAGATVYAPANAALAFHNGARPLRALQVFANPGPESKYDGWAKLVRPPLAHETRCRELAEVYCAPPSPADIAAVEDEDELDTVPFERLSLEAQATWIATCRERVAKLDDAQLGQFDSCVGCVASCEDAMDCLAGADLCEL